MFTSAGSVPAAQAANLSRMCTLKQQKKKSTGREEKCVINVERNKDRAV